MIINIGKNGLTDGVLTLIKNGFKDRETIKISVLKAAGHTKENVTEISNKILQTLGDKYLSRIIGFTIVIKKLKKKNKKL